MAEFDFIELSKKYGQFDEPLIVVVIDGKELDTKQGLNVTDAEVDLTSGYEASIAEIILTGCFDPVTRSFDINKVKKYLYLGSTIKILLGYDVSVREVFRGFISAVHFVITDSDSEEMPHIEVTAMDVKGIMMANRHSKRLNSKYYSDAVKEILDANAFLSQTDEKMNKFMEIVIDDTPDKKEGGGGAGGAGGGGAASSGGNSEETSDTRVEMVEESDYEFIVKAAKKYNYEFMSICGSLYFIKAKSNDTILLETGPGLGMLNLDVGYDITGLVKSVEVRNVDQDKGGQVKDKVKSSLKISLGNKAKSLIEKQSLIYLDPTAGTKEEAGYRASYLMEQINYRLGSLEANMNGLPELVPGRFIMIKNAGDPLNNKFYLTRVKHVIGNDGYITFIEGKASSIESK